MDNKKKMSDTLVAELVEDFTDTDLDLATDTLWVYEHLADKSVKSTGTWDAKSKAPNRGAFSLLKWARENEQRFFENVLPKAMAVKKKRDEEDNRLLDAERDISRVRRMLGKMNEKDTLSIIKLEDANRAFKTLTDKYPKGGHDRAMIDKCLHLVQGLRTTIPSPYKRVNVKPTAEFLADKAKRSPTRKTKQRRVNKHKLGGKVLATCVNNWRTIRDMAAEFKVDHKTIRIALTPHLDDFVRRNEVTGDTKTPRVWYLYRGSVLFCDNPFKGGGEPAVHKKMDWLPPNTEEDPRSIPLNHNVSEPNGEKSDESMSEL